MSAKLKTEILDRRIQEIEITDQGVVLASDNSIFDLPEKSSIANLHPFFEGVIPILPTVKDSLKIPCVNVDSVSDPRIVDVDFLRKGEETYVLSPKYYSLYH